MPALTWPHGARSIIEMTGDGCFEFTVRPTSFGLVCGLNTADSGTNPSEITHGFMVYKDQFCVIERGVMRTVWWSTHPTPDPDAGLPLRIYRIGGKVVYTVGFGSISDPDVFQSIIDDFGWSSYLYDTRLGGEVVYQSTAPSYGTVFLDSSMAEADESIYNARLLDVETDTESGDYVRAASPGWGVRATEAAPANDAYIVLPAWGAAASDLGDNRVRVTTPAWSVTAGEPAFSIQYSEVRVKLPSWRTEDPALKSAPKQLPAWRAKAQGPNQTIATTPGWRSHSGDAISLVYATLPAWSVTAMAPRDMTGLAYGQVVLPITIENYVVDDSMLTTDTMTAILGGAITPYGSLTLDTAPLELHTAGTGPVYAESTLPVSTMVAVLGGSITAYAEVTLGTATLQGVLGGAIVPMSEVTLPTVPMPALLGGGMGMLSRLNEVFVLCLTGEEPGGTTRYTNYEMNSFVEIDGKYYGASSDGLYLLEGSDDAGAPIDASFGFGQLDFGTPQVKTVSYCYLSASAAGMQVDMQALLKGVPASYSYVARGHGSSMRELRFTLGKGLRSSYVIPTFHNIAGGDFEVDAVRFMLAESARRI